MCTTKNIESDVLSIVLISILDTDEALVVLS
jgi:hypothetical protein